MIFTKWVDPWVRPRIGVEAMGPDPMLGLDWGGSYTPPVSGAGVRGRVPRPRRMSSWTVTHEIYCIFF
jgi:hypothetical protein